VDPPLLGADLAEVVVLDVDDGDAECAGALGERAQPAQQGIRLGYRFLSGQQADLEIYQDKGRRHPTALSFGGWGGAGGPVPARPRFGAGRRTCAANHTGPSSVNA